MVPATGFRRLAALAAAALATSGCARLAGVTAGAEPALEPAWLQLSSAAGDLAAPGASDQQTAAVVADLDGDAVQDFVIGARGQPPALVWYRRAAAGWQRLMIEPDRLPIEAGGATYDIDHDGDLDLVMGADASGNQVWWWENPEPGSEPPARWRRHVIKESGGNQHHDQIFADLNGDGRAELVFWNQRARRLLLAVIPADPRASGPWPVTTVFEAPSERFEGLAAADVDGNGRVDLVGAGRWFERTGDGRFTAHLIDRAMHFSRAAAGQLVPGGRPEVVFGVGDDTGPLRWYQWDGSAWAPHDLLGADIVHGHSLALGDVDLDGNLDIFAAEMADPGHAAAASAWIFYGDGRGDFRKEVVSRGQDHHESQLADLDGDRDLDILAKPYHQDAPRLDVLLNRRARLDRWRRHVIDPVKPWRSVFVTAADLDGDGQKDIGTGGWWYQNPGAAAGRWQRRPIGEPLRNLAAVHDFDRDGDLDVLGTEGQGADPNPELVWAENDGRAWFTIHANLEPGDGDFLQGVAIGPFRGERPQVALSWHAAGRGIQMLSVPDDPARDPWRLRKISEFSQDEALTAGDIDRDGRIDLLLGTRWLRNLGDAFELQQIGPEPLPDRNRLGDLNGDGRLDAVVGFEAISKQGEVVWYEQPRSAANRWTRHPIATVIGPMSLDVGDLDGDRDLDVVVGEHNLAAPATAKLWAFENADGRGGRWLGHIVAVGDEHHDGAILADIDADRDLDILSIGWSHDRLLLYENRAITGPEVTDFPGSADRLSGPRVQQVRPTLDAPADLNKRDPAVPAIPAVAHGPRL